MVWNIVGNIAREEYSLEGIGPNPRIFLTRKRISTYRTIAIWGFFSWELTLVGFHSISPYFPRKCIMRNFIKKIRTGRWLGGLNLLHGPKIVLLHDFLEMFLHQIIPGAWMVFLINKEVSGTCESTTLSYKRYCPEFRHYYRADSRFVPSQWETSLQSNAVYHWLGANLESAVLLYDDEREGYNHGSWHNNVVIP